MCPPMDVAAFRFVNRLTVHTEWAHGAASWYARDGIVLFAVALVVAWLAARHAQDAPARVAAVVWAGAAGAAAVAVAKPVASLVARPRPFVALSGVHLLVPHVPDPGFPSDHAVAAGAVAAGLLLALRPVGLVTAVLAVVMAFTRVYVGVHYPGDVVAGLALGALVAWGGSVLLGSRMATGARRVAATRLRPLVVAGRRHRGGDAAATA